MQISKAVKCGSVLLIWLSLVLPVTVFSEGAKQPDLQTAEKSVVKKEPDLNDRGIEKLKKQLDLNEEQVKAVTKIYQEAREARESSRNSAFMVNPNPNYLDLPPDSKEYDLGYKKAAEIAARNASDRIVLVAESRKKVYALLNDEQKKKFIALNRKQEYKREKLEINQKKAQSGQKKDGAGNQVQPTGKK